MIKQKRLLVITGLALVLLGLTTLPYWLSQQEVQLHAKGCYLNTTQCIAKKDEVQIALSVQPQAIASLKPLTFFADINHPDTKRVVLDLQGKEMYMGLNQIELTLNPATHLWEGTTELAVCTTGEMIWLATVSVFNATGTATTHAQFEFTAR